MAEYDFESEIGRRLNARKIAPSANAWDRVNLQRNRQTKKSHSYIYKMAAILIIALGILFLINPSEQVETRIAIEEIPVPESTVNQTPEPAAATSSTKAITAPTAIVTHQKRQPHKTATPIYIGVAELEKIKIDEITATITLMADSGKEISEDDLDLLIENARREIAAGNGLTTPTDPTALLKNSESELDDSFRGSVIENLLQHKKIKLALGNN